MSTEEPEDPERLQDLVSATRNADEAFETVAPEEEGGLPFRRAGPVERRLVATIGSALRVARLHALDNVVATEALRDFLASLQPFLEKHGQATIVVGDLRISVNGATLRLKRTGRTWLNDFLEFLERMGVYGLVLKGTWSDATAKAFVGCFTKVQARTPEERVRLIAAAAQAVPEPARVEVLDLREAASLTSESDDASLTDTQRAAFYYARLLAICEASHIAVASGRAPDFHVRELRYTLMKIIDFLRTGVFELRLLGITVLPYTRHDPLAGHAANVAILSIAMGRLLGLGKGALSDLGFAALYHDMGRVPEGWLEDDRKRAHDERHVVRGVGYSLRARSFGDAGLLRIAVSQEHHRKADRYPRTSGLRQPHLFSRIVAVADAFDRLEKGSPAVPPISPAKALRGIRSEEKRFERPLTELLQDVLGRTPRGTLLRMRDGSLSVVIDGGARRGHKAVARRLLLPSGEPDHRRVISEVVEASVQSEVDPQDAAVEWRRAVIA